jgi:hypothetical protein
MIDYLLANPLLIAALITAAITIYSITTKRKHDLEDRDYKLRVEKRKEKIQEVLEYIDAIIVGNDKLYDNVFFLVQALKRKDFETGANEFNRAKVTFMEVRNLSRDAIGKEAGKAYLKDKKLDGLVDDFRHVGNEMIDEASKFFLVITNKEKIDLDKTMERMISLRNDSYKLSTAIKMRLDELALMK